MTTETRDATKTAARKPQVLKGFRDYLPAQMILRRRIIELFRGIFERHGFEPLDTPAIEYLEVLAGKAGENEKLMYRWEDQGEREVGLRYDLTVPLARVVAMHQNDLVLPFKRYHIAPVWRAEKPQRGRFREFWQCDADIAGSSSPLADAEAVSIVAEALTAVGLPGFVIRVNHRAVLEGLARVAGVAAEGAAGVYRAVDKLDKIGPDGVTRELTAAGASPGAAARVLDLVATEGDPGDVLDRAGQALAGQPEAAAALDELRQLVGYLNTLGVAPGAVRLDLALARGLDYYTGVVFEATVEEPKIGSVAGAGRYDGLVGAFLGRPVPATGLSLGLERIIEVVQEFDLLPSPPTVAQVFVAALPETLPRAAALARELRAVGLNTDLTLQPNRGLGDQLKYAGRRAIPLAAIVGHDEAAGGTVLLRDLRTREQSALPLADVAASARRLLDLPPSDAPNGDQRR